MPHISLPFGFFWRQSLSLISKAGSLSKLVKAGLGLSILITVIPGLLTGPALPSVSLVVFTLLGTWLTACASFVYNQIIEKDKDALMKRTQKRPLVEKKISLIFAHILGSSLLFLGLYILSVGSHPLAALIAFFSFAYYVFIYTALLKPRTHWNTVLGGIAGSVGPLIGEAAVSGRISEYGLVMFLLLFLWQPAHFWCLGIHYQDDYRRASIPILPVKKGVELTLRQIFLYQFFLCAVILLISIPPLELTGPIFLFPSLLCGLVVLYFMHSLKKKSSLSLLHVFALTIFHMILWHISLSFDLYLRLWFVS